MSLRLIRARVSRNSGYWSEDDYDVFDGETDVGRVYVAEAGAPEDLPWWWGIDFFERRGPGPHQGNAGSLDEAKLAFRAAWERQAGLHKTYIRPT